MVVDQRDASETCPPEVRHDGTCRGLAISAPTFKSCVNVWNIRAGLLVFVIGGGEGGGWNHERGDIRVDDFFGIGLWRKKVGLKRCLDYILRIEDHQRSPAVEEIVGVLQERLPRKAGHLRTSRPYKIYVDVQRNPVGGEHADIPKDASMKSFTSPRYSAISEFTLLKTLAINRDTTKSKRIIDLTVAERCSHSPATLTI
ncbi:hypothetical protein DFH09DRAFT_1069501 [Mycena vulgaris]|nr:hypothetical protein DFH09DRAFT_1069501 [Mycena vulgaris]